MRMDDRAAKLPVTPDQRLFLGCWYALVHMNSLDSHRMRSMNPRNALREILAILNAEHANGEDRARVCEEAARVLEADFVLTHSSLTSIRHSLHRFLDPKKISQASSLVCHYARELLYQIEKSYVPLCLDLLGERLLAPPEPDPDRQRQRSRELVTLTAGLLSTLVDAGVTLESLYQLYAEILVPRRPHGTYQFERKLNLARKLIEKPAEDHEVLFAVDGVKAAARFPNEIGGIKFSADAPGWRNGSQSDTYLRPHVRRVFGQVGLRDNDFRTAGRRARDRISHILDLARFEHERDKIQLSDEFLVRKASSHQIRRYAISRIVPNPESNNDETPLHSFVESVNELLSGNFHTAGRERVLAAFRLYRAGDDSNVFDTKLVHWWTATEYLTRGLKIEKGGIGGTVETWLTPVLCNQYLRTLFLDLHASLVHLRADFRDTNDAAVDLKVTTTLDLFKAVSRSPHTRNRLIDSLGEQPYFQFKTGELLSQVATPKACLELIRAHEKRVRWQIQRIWRARCDIVHNAKQPSSDFLLCANLESYLKGTLHVLLSELRQVQTLTSPEEFFERQADRFLLLNSDLEANSFKLVEQSFVA